MEAGYVGAELLFIVILLKKWYSVIKLLQQKGTFGGYIMAYNFTYNICAIILLSIILITHVAKKKMRSVQNGLYTVLTILALCGAIVDIADAWGILRYRNTPLWLGYTTSYLYYSLQGLVTFVFALYVMAMMERTIKEEGIVTKICMITPMVLQFAILITNPFTKALFYYDSNGIYHRGGYQFVIYILIMIYVVYVAAYCAALRDVLPVKMQITLCICVMMVCIPSIFQMFFPSQLIVYFGVSIAILVIYMNIQKPEEYLDTITGLFNTVCFKKNFGLNTRYNQKNHLILLYIEDVAVLKQVMGIESTNYIMCEIAAYLEQQFPGNAYSLGSEMFGIMLRCEDEKDVREIMHSLDDRFLEKWHYGSGETDITARLIEIRLPEDATDLETIYSYMDYLRALDSTHKWFLYARAVDMQFVQRKVEVEGAIRRAIENESFEMHYQPIYSVNDESIATAEALVRLQDPELGMISPAEFIPIAERSGLILPVGDIIFKKVFSFIQKNDLLKKGVKYIEINLSMVQCMQDNFADRLSEMMHTYGIDSSRINLEVTETAAVNSPRRLRENMLELYERGIRFSLDDFGTGYSNIDSLMDLPLDMIKLDKSMIDMATQEDKGKIVLNSAIAMVKRMNMKIVAEGVETRAQKEYLEEMGIDFLQGYYFAKPMPEEDFVAFIEHFNIRL